MTMSMLMIFAWNCFLFINLKCINLHSTILIWRFIKFILTVCLVYITSRLDQKIKQIQACILQSPDQRVCLSESSGAPAYWFCLRWDWRQELTLRASRGHLVRINDVSLSQWQCFQNLVKTLQVVVRNI